MPFILIGGYMVCEGEMINSWQVYRMFPSYRSVLTAFLPVMPKTISHSLKRLPNKMKSQSQIELTCCLPTLSNPTLAPSFSPVWLEGLVVVVEGELGVMEISWFLETWFLFASVPPKQCLHSSAKDSAALGQTLLRRIGRDSLQVCTYQITNTLKNKQIIQPFLTVDLTRSTKSCPRSTLSSWRVAEKSWPLRVKLAQK